MEFDGEESCFFFLEIPLRNVLFFSVNKAVAVSGGLGNREQSFWVTCEFCNNFSDDFTFFFFFFLSMTMIYHTAGLRRLSRS